MNADDQRTIAVLEERLKTILPEEYQESYESLEPAPMRSAGLRFSDDGKVAWNQIWGSFCDLAMAGGPPHKGTLLEPGRASDVLSRQAESAAVVQEICRGVVMVTGLAAEASPNPGWVAVTCLSDAMAGWLLRAITMENVSVRATGTTLELPAAPDFRLDKEIKNVITVVAKTCHYWDDHMPRSQQRAIAELFTAMQRDSPLVTPSAASDSSAVERRRVLAAGMADRLRRDAGLEARSDRHPLWLGVTCPTVRRAVWMMRTLVAANVLARREDTVLFVPVNPETDPAGDVVVGAVTRVHALAAARGLL